MFNWSKKKTRLFKIYPIVLIECKKILSEWKKNNTEFFHQRSKKREMSEPGLTNPRPDRTGVEWPVSSMAFTRDLFLSFTSSSLQNNSIDSFKFQKKRHSWRTWWNPCPCCCELSATPSGSSKVLRWSNQPNKRIVSQREGPLITCWKNLALAGSYRIATQSVLKMRCKRRRISTGAKWTFEMNLISFKLNVDCRINVSWAP